MGHSARKGNCSSCKVCKAYLRETFMNQAKNEATLIKAEKPARPSPGEKAVKADPPDDEKLKQTACEISGCPEARPPK